MKTKLFLFALLLSASIASLQAIPEPGGDESEGGDGKKTEQQQQIADGLRSRTAASSNSGGESSSSAARLSGITTESESGKTTAASSSSGDSTPTAAGSAEGTKPKQKKFEELSLEEQATIKTNGLLNAEQLIYRAHQAADSDAGEWSKILIKISRAKNWSENIINPPPLSTLDRWLGRSPKQYTEEEIQKARLVHVRALALEVALPALQKSVAAQKAINLSREPVAEVTLPLEAPAWWAFWKKASEAPVDRHVDADQKIEACAKAWEEAEKKLLEHRDQLPELLNNEVLSLWTGTKTREEIPGRLAHAWDDSLKELANKKLSSAASLNLFKDQQNVEKAFDDNKQENMTNRARAVRNAIEKLRGHVQTLSDQQAKQGPFFKSAWEEKIKRLNYIITVYEALLADQEFYDAHDAYEKEIKLTKDAASALGEVETRGDAVRLAAEAAAGGSADAAATASAGELQEPAMDPAYSAELLNDVKTKGAAALAAWEAARKAKKEFFSEESYQKMTLRIDPEHITAQLSALSGEEKDIFVNQVLAAHSKAHDQVLTPEERAAKGRLMDFQEAYEEIKTILNKLGKTQETEIKTADSLETNRDDEIE